MSFRAIIACTKVRSVATAYTSKREQISNLCTSIRSVQPMLHKAHRSFESFERIPAAGHQLLKLFCLLVRMKCPWLMGWGPSCSRILSELSVLSRVFTSAAGKADRDSWFGGNARVCLWLQLAFTKPDSEAALVLRLQHEWAWEDGRGTRLAVTPLRLFSSSR